MVRRRPEATAAAGALPRLQQGCNYKEEKHHVTTHMQRCRKLLQDLKTYQSHQPNCRSGGDGRRRSSANQGCSNGGIQPELLSPRNLDEKDPHNSTELAEVMAVGSDERRRRAAEIGRGEDDPKPRASLYGL